MIKIRATYSWRKGTAPCTRCPEDPNNVYMSVMFGKQPTFEAAQLLLYESESWFRPEREIQNGKYRHKSNFSRIMSTTEWMSCPRHSPREYLLQIGNTKFHPPANLLISAYREFYKWRLDTFPEAFVLVGAAIYGCTVPHVHERIVFYWEDDEGIKHTGIEKSLQKAGLERPFPKMPEGRTNNCKIAFDDICREKWLDIVEDKLRDSYPDIKLIRPEPKSKSKPIIKFDRALRLTFKNQKALRFAESRQKLKTEKITETLDDLRKKQQAFQSEMDAGDVPKERKAELKEQMLIAKNKIKMYETRLLHASQKKAEICANLNGR